MNDLARLKKAFKKHYKRASRLKEGGKAWQREIDQARVCFEACKRKIREEERKKYNY